VAAKTPIATLGRPVPLAAPAEPNRLLMQDQQLRPASFSAPLFLARGKNSDAPKPLPPGDLDEGDSSTPSNPAAKATTQKPGPHPLTPVAPEVTDSSGSVSAASDCDSGSCADGCCFSPHCCWTPLWWIRPSTWCIWDHFRNVDPGYEPCIYGSAEYLLWWIKDSNLPALVTTSPPGTPRQMAGVLGAPGTSVLFGGTGISNEERSGGRFTIGWWCDDCRTIGLEGSFLFLGERSTRFDASSPGLPILARPFFDVLAGQEASELVAFPGVVGGRVSVTSSSELWGAELNLRTAWWRGCWWHVDGFLGFRYFGLKESLQVGEDLIIPNQSRITVLDQFSTRNNFYGGQLGFEVGFQKHRWSLDLLGKVALGSTQETINIAGGSTFAVPGTPTTAQAGGLLALPTNGGRFNRDTFAVLPEAGVKLGYQLTNHVKFFVGYTFLYISDVARPGHEIDRSINVSQLASQFGPGTLSGPARPAPIPKGTDFWAQGVNLGLEVRY
jgi:hypothetical protein